MPFIDQFENREAYNKYFREYRQKNLARLREIGRESMKRIRSRNKIKGKKKRTYKKKSS